MESLPRRRRPFDDTVLVPSSQLPSLSKIIGLMVFYTSKIMSVVPNKLEANEKIDTIEQFSQNEIFNAYRNYAGHKFYSDLVSLETSQPYPSKARIKTWITILTNNLIRPLRHSPNYRFMSQDTLVGYSHPFPYLPEIASGTLSAAFCGNSLTPTTVINRQRKHYLLSTETDGTTGYTILRDKSHKNNCFCGLLIENNQIEFCLFSTICFPSDMFSPRINVNIFQAEKPKYLNPSITFFSYVNSHGVLNPYIIARQSLAEIQRKSVIKFKPPFATVNFEANHILLANVSAAINRGEYSYFMKYYQHECEKSGHDYDSSPTESYRFPSLKSQQRNDDLRHRNLSMDTVLNNCVFVNPFYGAHMCPFCDSIIWSNGFDDLLIHLRDKHRKLRTSLFSCPSCLSVSIQSWDTFNRHFKMTHSPVLGFLTVLCETNVSQRTAWGTALLAIITINHTVENFLTELETCNEPNEFIYIHGGFVNVSKNEAREYRDIASAMSKKITELRLNKIPPHYVDSPYKKDKPSRNHESDTDEEEGFNFPKKFTRRLSASSEASEFLSFNHASGSNRTSIRSRHDSAESIHSRIHDSDRKQTEADMEISYSDILTGSVLSRVSTGAEDMINNYD